MIEHGAVPAAYSNSTSMQVRCCSSAGLDQRPTALMTFEPCSWTQTAQSDMTHESESHVRLQCLLRP